MAINPSQLGATPTDANYDVAIELLTTRPDAGVYMATPVTPNKLVRYYDAIQDQVELYIVDNTGYRYLRIS
jgi:hypothetical protein